MREYKEKREMTEEQKKIKKGIMSLRGSQMTMDEFDMKDDKEDERMLKRATRQKIVELERMIEHIESVEKELVPQETEDEERKPLTIVEPDIEA